MLFVVNMSDGRQVVDRRRRLESEIEINQHWSDNSMFFRQIKVFTLAEGFAVRVRELLAKGRGDVEGARRTT
jgi:hypothetical protein